MKKMRNKLIIFIGVILLTVGLILLYSLTSNAESSTTVNGRTWYYTLSEDGEATYVYTKTAASGDLEIPSELDGYPVTSLGCTSSGYNMFYNKTTSLTSITIPDTVKEIKYYAFYNVTVSGTIILPESMTSISSYSFYLSKIKGISMPDTITEIEEMAFYGSSLLENVTLSNNLTSIGGSAFSSCKLLGEITFPKSLTSIGNSAFYNCTSLQEITFPESITSIGNYTFRSCTSLQEITFPENITSIGNYAFESCTSLQEITFSENLTSIGNYAFSNCTALEEITFPDNLTSIGYSVFSNCTALKEITFSESLTSIESSAFSRCTSLEEITFPEGLKTIGSSAFASCTSLDYENLEFPDSLESIGDQAFYCSNVILEDLSFGSNISSIGTSIVYEIKDIYLDVEEGTVSYGGQISYTGNEPYLHYKGCSHTLDFSSVDGVRFINNATGEELEGTVIVECNSDFSYSIEIDAGLNTEGYTYVHDTEPTYSSDDTIRETSSLSDVVVGSYQLENVTRNEGFYVLKELSNETDLSARIYVNKINSIEQNNRIPTLAVKNGEVSYKHDKSSVSIETGDYVEFNIRIYNEGLTEGYATEISLYLSDGLEFDEASQQNINNGWYKDANGTVKTTYIKDTLIDPCEENGIASYIEIPVVCKVTREKQEEDTRMVAVMKITGAGQEDYDSTFEELQIENIDDYMKEEGKSSNSNSYVKSSDDCIDFESLMIKVEDEVEYNLKILKIDEKSNELLSGAKFNLLNSDGEIIKTEVTSENGTLDFGIVSLSGDSDVYYIEEVETPIGYDNDIKYKIKLEIEKTKNANGDYEITAKCDIYDIKIDLSKIEKEEITTVEQLRNVESNKSYILMNDLDLSGINWTPIENITNCIIDGNGYKISNLNIDATTEEQKVYGLFKEFDGSIINLTLENVQVSITQSQDETETEDDYAVGSLIGIAGNVYIENCSINGQVTTEVSNIGGIIGTTKEETLAIIRETTSDVTVTAGKSNAGGFIGYSKGAVNIINCTVTAEVSAGEYNAAGYIGRADYSDYEFSKAIVYYSDNENEIIMVINNSTVENSYNLQLETVEAGTLNIIADAQYEIYNENKEKIAEETIEEKDGKIYINNIKIESISSDIYYLKQLSTKEGYSILTDDYIRIKVIKTWDSTENKYKVGVEGSIISEEEFKNDSEVELEGSSTGIIYEKTIQNEVEWTVGKVGIIDSTINGNIYAELGNASGAIGRTDAYVVLENVSNKATVEAEQYNASGLIAEVLEEEKTKVNIYNCSNDNTITATNGIAGGLVGYTSATIVVDNSNNNSTLQGENAAKGGIIGNAETAYITVTNCNNYGDIYVNTDVELTEYTYNYSCATGGIIGRVNGLESSDIYGSTLTISNCTNNANIDSLFHTGGIIGVAIMNNIQIENCEVSDTETTSLGANGGILGFTKATDINVVNCNVEDTNMIGRAERSSSGCTGGIIGQVNYTDITVNSLVVLNNTTNNISMDTTSAAGGIIGNIYSGNKTSEANIYICYNEIDDFSLTVPSECSSLENFGGILGYGDFRCPVYINENKIANMIIDYQGANTGDIGIGGIIGIYNQSKSLINISNCKLKDVELNDNSNSRCVIGGIMGYDGNTGSTGSYNLNINNIDVDNLKINATFIKKTSTAVGGVIGSVCTSNLYLNYIDITNLDIIANMGNVGEVVSSSELVVGGLVGTAYTNKTNISIDNCSIDTCNITSETGVGDIGGFIGFNYSLLEISNSYINNMLIDGESTYYYGKHRSIGGIVAASYESINMDNVSLTNCYIYEEIEAIAGLIAYCNKSVTLNDVTLDDVHIIDEVDPTAPLYSSYTIRALLLGYASGSEISNLTIKNSSLTANTITAGIIDNPNYANNIDGLIIENVEIKSTGIYNSYTPYTNNPNSVGGIFSSIYSGSNSVKNANIANLTVESGSSNIGVIAGSAGANNLTLENITMSGITLNYLNENENAFTNSIGIGGLIGVISSSYDFSNIEIDDININVSEGIQTNVKVGGLIGYQAMLQGTIDDLNVSNLNINVYGTNPEIGGLIGYSNLDYVPSSSYTPSSSFALNNAVVENVKIETYNSSNSTDTSKLGGIIGYQVSEQTDSTINGLTITNVEIGSETTKNYDMGGLVGSLKGNIDLTDVDASEITLKNGNTIGGLIGFNSISDEDNSYTNITLGNVTITDADYAGGAIGRIEVEDGQSASITGMEISDSNISANMRAGGIISEILTGVSVDTAKVTNTTVTSKVMAGGITSVALGDITNSEISESTITTTSEESNESYAGGIAGFSSKRIESCKVSDSIIEAQGESAYATGGILGHGDEGSSTDSYVGYCTVENTTIIGENQVGEIVGDSILISEENTAEGCTIEINSEQE